MVDSNQNRLIHLLVINLSKNIFFIQTIHQMIFIENHLGFLVRCRYERFFTKTEWSNYSHSKNRFRNLDPKYRKMTRICLLSDTHGCLDAKIIKHLEWADEVWHAGDIGTISLLEQLEKAKPTRAVFGNIDGHQIRAACPENQIFYCEKVKVLIRHIGGYPGRYNATTRQLLDEHQPKLYICGHSHILKVQNDLQKKLLHMNPGAAGRSGFHQMRTLLRFTIDEDRIENLEVAELGRRSAS